MRKKIYRRLTGIALFSILITVAAITALFYSRLKKQVFADLEIMAQILSGETLAVEPPRGIPGDIRVTLIDAAGKVRYDSAADTALLENHLDRPEVREALQKGFGYGVRRSDTLSESIFYYAILTEQGEVLRVGRASASVAWMILSALPIAVAVSLGLVVVCMAVSHYLTASIVAPVERAVENMDRLDESGVYEEMLPFIRKIRSQHEEILSAANMRQEFTANVTHELKTPLTAISGYAELMASGVAKESDTRHFSQEIGKSAARLLNLIDDIIKLSRLDAGSEEEIMEVVDLAGIARDTVEMLSLHAAEMNVHISYTGCDSARVRMGKELAEELTYNLIENAIRYNRPGGMVEAAVVKRDAGLSFIVSDTGIGIPEEYQERVFERFYRVDKSRSKELGGTGLGLAIVKHICNLTQGEIRLESKEGQGTTFTVSWDGGLAGIE